jgi:protease-4
MRKLRTRYVVLATFLILAGAALIVYLARRGAVPKKTILELDLETKVSELVPSDPFALVSMQKRLSLRDIVDVLERAGDDERVVGLIARIGGGGVGFAHAQELRDALRRFSEKKKFSIAFAETFGEFGPGNAGYYLATAFDEVRMQPSGDVGLTGLYLETFFIKGTLDKLGMKFRGDQRYEYKNAFNSLTETSFTPAHREAMEALKKSLFGQLIRGVAERRKLSDAEVQTLVDRGPFLGKEALDAKLVDALSYRDEVYADAKKRAGEGAELLYAHKYLEYAGRPHRDGKSTIALVYGVGAVMRGKSGNNPLEGQNMGSDTVGLGLRKAIEDENVKAIILRVDSPGGSYVASDAIWREVVRATKKGKPVIASMANLAASGGYFVSMAATKIVAEPGTITGSIGVFGGKPIITDFWKKIGISFDHVQAGANAGMFSTNSDFTPSEWKRLQSWLDRVYVDFTTKVAEGRKLPKEQVLKVARGRVWTGEEAKAAGLVDELGGLGTALRLAKEAAHIGPEEKVRVKVLPRPKRPPLEQLQQFFGGDEPENSEKEGGASILARVLAKLEPVVRSLRLFTSTPDDIVLLAPFVGY